MATISTSNMQSKLKPDGPTPRMYDNKQRRRANIAAAHTATPNQPTPSTKPRATSVLLQGTPTHATKTLFLFPDGSGSAASYTHLSLISPSTAVYGLNCPYLLNPSAWTGGPQDLTPLYTHEIRRRQPHGPYYLGGYSTGGILAFDAAQALDRAGETIARLILIDAPCPIHIKPLPPRLMDFLKSIDVFGSRDKAPPAWLYPHFEANTAALQRYRVRPFEAYREPVTKIIWAGRGVCEDLEPEVAARLGVEEGDPKEMKWIMWKREDWSAMGWEKLLNGDEIAIEVLEGFSHFSMMKGEGARRLGGLIGRAME